MKKSEKIPSFVCWYVNFVIFKFSCYERVLFAIRIFCKDNQTYFVLLQYILFLSVWALMLKFQSSEAKKRIQKILNSQYGDYYIY